MLIRQNIAFNTNEKEQKEKGTKAGKTLPITIYVFNSYKKWIMNCRIIKFKVLRNTTRGESGEVA